MPVPLLALRREGEVAHMRMSDPRRHNALGERMMDEMIAFLDTLRRGPNPPRVLVLSGAGPDFCVGGDLTEFDDLIRQDPTGSGVVRLSQKAARLFSELSASEMVTIAQVHGRWIGAGIALASACHLRVASEDSLGSLPELALRLPMAWGGAMHQLVAEIGQSRVRQLMLTRESITGEMALQMGIVHRITPVDGLDEAVARWTDRILRGDRQATTTSLELLRKPVGVGIDAVLMAAALSARQQAGVRGSLEEGAS
ncbi:enoyl-CoA hydratase/isomerase family protein [Streptomyces sp. NPDC015125]|uniref:enoyl-CoA hydratase/isomerase family protein n=1 Tax=Streptomyces sp. NPDC015125 TaxID=3364938 RepID=UPI0036F82460